MKKSKIIKNSLLVLLMLVLIVFTSISLAYNEDNNLIIEEENYTKEYEKWLALSDQEKENYIMPSMYPINIEPNNAVSILNIDAFAGNDEIPTAYNSLENLEIQIRDQGITNSCWAVTSTELFEILYAKTKNLEKTISFSSRHIDYATSNVFANNVINEHGFNRTVGSGGRFEYAMAYYTSGKGPILETDMPFENNKDIIEISKIQNKQIQAQLEDYTEFPTISKSYDEFGQVFYTNGASNSTELISYSQTQIDNFRKEIKKQIMQYGAIAAYTYYNSANNFFSEEEGYILGNSYYCNDTSINMNHTVCIIGWDDTYSKTNFKEGCQPVHDGAYIALNSWGTEWNSRGGFYYISYDDYFVENGMVGLQSMSDIDYDNLYQYDELGYSARLGSLYDPTTIYGANTFYRNNNSRESLSEIGLKIYNTSNVTIYLNNSNNFDTSNSSIIATATNLTPGYHCIKLNTPILVGKTFSIIVKYENNIKAQLPLEAKLSSDTSKYYYVTSNIGESFYSLDGEHFVDLYNFESNSFDNANICIKAFTINETESAKDTDYILNENWRIINNSEENILYGIEENTSIIELLSSNNFSNNYTVKAYKNNIEISDGKVTTGTAIKIFNNSNLIKEYTIVIYGDTNLDGDISSVDALAIVKNRLGTEVFKENISEEAGKVTLQSRTLNLTPSAVDALAVVKHKLGVEQISQY